MHKRLGIISDTHGVLREEVVDHLNGCDMIIHAGDFHTEAILRELEKTAPVTAVRGNNDRASWARRLKRDVYFQIGDLQLYMVHQRKHAPKDLTGIDIVIFGHSHKYYCRHEEGRLWLNPGSCGRKRFDLALTFVVMDVWEDHYHIERILL